MTGDCDAAARIGRPMPAALHIVGLGPGSADCLTPQAERALAASACIAVMTDISLSGERPPNNTAIFIVSSYSL